MSQFLFHFTKPPDHCSKGESILTCTFLEDGPPISDAPVLESRPTDTRPSSSSPCGLCPIPTTAAEPIHEPDSTPSSPYSSEDDNPPTDSDDVSSHGFIDVVNDLKTQGADPNRGRRKAYSSRQTDADLGRHIRLEVDEEQADKCRQTDSGRHSRSKRYPMQAKSDETR
ncbi:hypothetical protein Tco_1444828 [Tanacetum coccineum]